MSARVRLIERTWWKWFALALWFPELKMHYQSNALLFTINKTSKTIQLVHLIVHLDAFARDLFLRMHCTPLTPIKVIEIMIYSPLKDFLHFFPIHPPIFHHPSI